MLEKLPKWGMIVDGVLYPLHPLERYTNAKGGFLLAHSTSASSNRYTEQEKETHPMFRKRCLMMATPTAEPKRVETVE